MHCLVNYLQCILDNISHYLFLNNVGWPNLFTMRKDLKRFSNEAANSFQGCVYSSLGCAPTEEGCQKDGHDRGLSLDLI